MYQQKHCKHCNHHVRVPCLTFSRPVLSKLKRTRSRCCGEPSDGLLKFTGDVNDNHHVAAKDMCGGLSFTGEVGSGGVLLVQAPCNDGAGRGLGRVRGFRWYCLSISTGWVGVWVSREGLGSGGAGCIQQMGRELWGYGGITPSISRD